MERVGGEGGEASPSLAAYPRPHRDAACTTWMMSPTFATRGAMTERGEPTAGGRSAADRAGWRLERYREPEDNPITLVPDWGCEVLSPTTAKSSTAARRCPSTPAVPWSISRSWIPP